MGLGPWLPAGEAERGWTRVWSPEQREEVSPSCPHSCPPEAQLLLGASLSVTLVSAGVSSPVLGEVGHTAPSAKAQTGHTLHRLPAWTLAGLSLVGAGGGDWPLPGGLACGFLVLSVGPWRTQVDVPRGGPSEHGCI